MGKNDVIRKQCWYHKEGHTDDGEDEEEFLWWTTKQPMSFAPPTLPGSSRAHPSSPSPLSIRLCSSSWCPESEGMDPTKQNADRYAFEVPRKNHTRGFSCDWSYKVLIVSSDRGRIEALFRWRALISALPVLASMELPLLASETIPLCMLAKMHSIGALQPCIATFLRCWFCCRLGHRVVSPYSHSDCSAACHCSRSVCRCLCTIPLHWCFVCSQTSIAYSGLFHPVCISLDEGNGKSPMFFCTDSMHYDTADIKALDGQASDFIVEDAEKIRIPLLFQKTKITVDLVKGAEKNAGGPRQNPLGSEAYCF